MSTPLQPSASILSKLGSLAVHLEELTSNNGHEFDRAAVGSILNDPEIRQWLKEMNAMAMLPVKR